MVYQVVEGELILGYLGLKEFGFQVDCTGDLLVREGAKKSCVIEWVRSPVHMEMQVKQVSISMFTYKFLKVGRQKVQ